MASAAAVAASDKADTYSSAAADDLPNDVVGPMEAAGEADIGATK